MRKMMKKFKNTIWKYEEAALKVQQKLDSLSTKFNWIHSTAVVEQYSSH